MKSFYQLVVVFVFLLLFAELLVRNLITTPAAAIPDKELGWVYKPHSTVFHTKEGWATNIINSMGFNDQEIRINQNKHRVFVVGDSYTEALQVPQSENFTSISEKKLECVNFVNAGRAGLSPIHYPIVVDRFLVNMPIDHVVMILTRGDLDEIENNNATIIRSPETGDIINIFPRVKKMGWLRKQAFFILSKSALATYLKDRIKALWSNEKPSVMPAKDIKNTKEIFEILSHVFKKINDKVPLSVLYIPSLEYFPESISKPKAGSVMFGELIRKASRSNKISYLSAQNDMEKIYKQYKRPPVGFQNNNILSGHLNKYGHESIANVLQKLIKIQCNL